MSKLLAQPTHPSTRQILNDAFGIPYSAHHSPRKGRQLRKRIMSGGTVNHLTVLPLINRRSALVSTTVQNISITAIFQITPPPISSTDAQYGLLSLLERGLIPVCVIIIKLCIISLYRKQLIYNFILLQYITEQQQ